MKTNNYKWIDFLSNGNVIKITSKKEFNTFKSFLCQCGLRDILNDCTTFESFQHLAKINNKKTDLFLFEYDNAKGLTWSDDIENSIEWYGKNPIEVADLQEFFQKKIIDCSILTNREKKLSDLVEIEENNMDCIVLRIKDNSRMALIKLGCFEGDEQLIRVSKGKDNTFTIFNSGKNFSWECGENGHTLISDNTKRKESLIRDCICNDFDIYIGGNEELIKSSLSIHCIEDTYNRLNHLKIMYWEGKQNEDVVTHKNGEFFKRFNSVTAAKDYFKNSGQVLTVLGSKISKTGCIVDEFILAKEQYYQLRKDELPPKKDSDFDYDYE